MNFRSHFYNFVLVVLFASALAVTPAIAQKTGKPLEKPHQAIPAGKDCSSCHKMTYREWKSGPHGENGVDCTVCHGDLKDKMAAAVPSLDTCDQCHSDKVAQLKSDPFMAHKTCVTCHPPHALKPHKTAPSTGKS